MPKSADKKKILVIEDERDMGIFLSRLLEAGGYEPIIAVNESEGLLKASQDNPDLIILDVMMTRQRGLEIYFQLKYDEKLNKIPVVMLSAIDEKTFFHYQKLPTIVSGQTVTKPEGFLGKPPETEELLCLLQTLTKTRGVDESAGE
ncbi:MAG: response regulator [Thermodesulfobacteriota bacterium]|nr:response regulator [Thermodesulfobacteriota bacterium]